MALFIDLVADTVLLVVENRVFVAPIVLFAIVLSSAIRASGADGLITRAFEGRTLAMVGAASALGAITLVCGIGVLPTISGLLRGGVPLAPIMPFGLSSPITDPAMLTVTAGLLGLPFAIGKTMTAFGIGMFGNPGDDRAGRFRGGGESRYKHRRRILLRPVGNYVAVLAGCRPRG